ncbi:unnamed protein product [Bemisia tabaci]|uniref:Uncharacterized protein n=1 Tax=Bemisia tabaci TaxID=7038 RepID=A0A9P0AFL9_BEMTA|nr:unnamed protein product [Bemisia tabaci]
MSSIDFRKDMLHPTTLAPPSRQRSVYTTTYHNQIDDLSYQRYSECPKYYEPLPPEQWPTNLVTNSPSSAAGFMSSPSSASLWRQPRSSKPMLLSYYDEIPYLDNWRDRDSESFEPGSGSGVATNYGTMSLRLHNRIRIDMTIDRAVRVINCKNNIVLALNGVGSAAALLHPNGRVYQYGSRVEILAHDARGNNKLAKMWYKGVSFTSELCYVVYLVDTAGTRTTTDTFMDLTQDFSLPVFYSDSRYGPAFINEAVGILQDADYWVAEDGTENWNINNVRISQTPDGLVRIARESSKFLLRTSPTNGTATLTTPYLHCTASMGQTSHLFVRRGERRMHYDGNSFIVRNAGHAAGFDERDQLKVY